MKKGILLRLDEALADQLRLVAEVDGSNVSEVVRGLVANHVAERRSDPSFRRRMDGLVRRHAELLAELASREEEA